MILLIRERSKGYGCHFDGAKGNGVAVNVYLHRVICSRK